MRVRTRLGIPVTIPDASIITQDKVIKRREIYYVLHLRNGSSVAVTDPVDGVPMRVLDESGPAKLPEPAKAPEYSERKLPSASDCPSAGGAMVAGTKVDYHAHEKVKGEMFFTHKTAPGLNIISPEGKVLRETKMSDMYKRRD